MRQLRAACLESLKELMELAGTQPQKFEMRPVWGASPVAEGLTLFFCFLHLRIRARKLHQNGLELAASSGQLFVLPFASGCGLVRPHTGAIAVVTMRIGSGDQPGKLPACSLILGIAHCGKRFSGPANYPLPDLNFEVGLPAFEKFGPILLAPGRRAN